MMIRRVFFGVVLSVLTSLTYSSGAFATVTGFNAGRIIDDSVFTNTATMTPQNIQSFLDSKVPTCDTYGTQMFNSWQTRAQYAATVGQSPPFTCLKDYTENGLSAAQIIYQVAQQYRINPQVLIVLLQKEQGLVTDSWPYVSQYQKATGYGCPDTAPCNTLYYGFTNQLTRASNMFRKILDNSPDWYTPYVLGNNYIQYNPSTSCGGSTVYIQNRSTQALYNYTPYQPNQAALDAGWGTAPCGAYGNRNFYLYFSTWFGSPNGGTNTSQDIRITSPITLSPAEPNPSTPLTISFTAKNFSSATVTIQYTLAQCRKYTNVNCDSPYLPAVTLVPQQEYTFTYTLPSLGVGDHVVNPLILVNGVWFGFGTEAGYSNSLYFDIPGLLITDTMSMSPSQPVAGTAPTYSFNVKNIDSRAITVNTSVIQCRLNAVTNCDSNYGGKVTLVPGQQMTFSYSMPELAPGQLTITPYFMVNGQWHKYFQDQTGRNSISYRVPGIRLTAPIQIALSQPVPGQATTVAYTVKNYGTDDEIMENSILQCRLNTSTNCDPAYNGPITLHPNEERTFTTTLYPTAGQYAFVPYLFIGGGIYKAGTEPGGTNTASLSVPEYVADTRLTSPIAFSPAQPVPGQSVTTTFTIKNFGDKPAIYQDSILQCRYNDYSNCDPAYTGQLTIAPGKERTFTVTIPNVGKGAYTFKPYYMQNGRWYSQQSGTQQTNTASLSVPEYVADTRLTSPVTFTPVQPAPGQSVTASFTVKNFGDKPAIYQDSILQCRYNSYYNCDTTYTGQLTMQPGEERTFTVTIPNVGKGAYTFKPYYMQNWKWYLQKLDPSGSSIASLSVN